MTTKRYQIEAYEKTTFPNPDGTWETSKVVARRSNEDDAIQTARELACACPANGHRVLDTQTGHYIADYPATQPKDWHWNDPGEDVLDSRLLYY